MSAQPLTIADYTTNGQPDNEHSWQPTSLITLAANPPEPPTIGGLLYPGKRTILSGETESLKTWLALILCKAELAAGYPVGWIDLDAMGPGAMLERLQLLDVPHTDIHHNFHYFQPNEMIDPNKRHDLCQHITNQQIRLLVIDAFNPILNLHQLDPNSTPDIETFWRTIADPICAAGAAPVLLDHVTKNAETRGKYAYGSERKASGAIVHIGFRLLEPLTKGGRGRSLLTVHKDRPGYLARPTIGRLIIDATNTTISYQLEPDKSHDPDTGGFRPTILMERISRALEPLTQPVSKTWVEENVPGNVKALRQGLDTLVEDGYLTAKQGARRAVDHTSIRPYRETQATPSSLRPHSVPDLQSSIPVTPSSQHPPPSGGVGRDGVEWATETDSVLTHSVPAGELLPEYDYPPVDDSEPEPFPQGDRQEPGW